MHHVSETEVDGYRAATLSAPLADLQATFIPSLAMLGTSLRFGADELLGARHGVAAYAERGATMGIPLLHPWANRLRPPRVGGHDLDLGSSRVHLDENGLAIHGLHLAGAGWDVAKQVATVESATLAGRLRFDQPDLLTQFPYPHELTVTAVLRDQTLSIATSLRPTGDVAVPIAFGWHPYLQLPRTRRADWAVGLPITRRAVLDEQMIPTGIDEAVSPEHGPLGQRTFDDLYTELSTPTVFTLEGADHRLEVAFGGGYRFAQIYAPANDDVISFEPMTAPINALATGQVEVVSPGDTFTATFSITVNST
jgi:galactose mutarotase-like enzyme